MSGLVDNKGKMAYKVFVAKSNWNGTFPESDGQGLEIVTHRRSYQ